MRILFFAPTATGSGHIVRGLSIAAALSRSDRRHQYAILSHESPFLDLARRFGVPASAIPAEDGTALGRDRWRESALFTAIDSFKPDILIVDQFWYPLEAFIDDLPCKKVLLTFQMDPRVFHIRLPDRELKFRPEGYDLLLRTEPGYEVPFASREVNPIVIRNRDEIMTRRAARADLRLEEDARACLFAFNGEPGEAAEAWKNFSYLEDEGWRVVRSHNREGGLFPAIDWFAAFDLLVCGAGYAAFWEARWLKKEAYFVSLPRRFENQARRASLFSDYEFETNGADELVGMLDSL